MAILVVRRITRYLHSDGRLRCPPVKRVTLGGAAAAMSDRVLSIVRTVGIANFALFYAAVLWLGGDAFNGNAEGGRFLLGSHGKFVEVTRAVWIYSYAHVLANFVTFPLAFIAAAITGYRRLLSPRNDHYGAA